MINIGIFCSGNGTNAEKIIQHFCETNMNVSFILGNKMNLGAYDVAEKYGIKYIGINDGQFNSENILNILEKNFINYIILAGFLKKIPSDIIKQYNNKIFNIHPSLLPKYGGQNMYGSNVHKAVLDNNEKESGITIHYVNEEYDKGNIIFQKECILDMGETVESLSKKIQKIEHLHYAKIVEKEINRIEKSKVIWY